MSELRATAPAATSSDAMHPRVDLPPAGPPMVAVAGVILALGLGLFLLLEGRRHAGEATLATQPSPAAGATITPPPPLAIPPAPPPLKAEPPPPKIQYVVKTAPPPPPMIQYIERPAPPPPMMAPRPVTGGAPEPVLIADLGSPAGAYNPTNIDDTAARATIIRNPSSLVAQGTVIPAVLETAIDSTRPGPTRALTTGDTRGFDGSRVLIPKGSRLIGETSADVQAGQKRVLVTWTRLIRPDGVTIRIGSPASDPLGGVGIGGHVNNHILARLTNAVLQTALTVGGEIAAIQATNGTTSGGTSIYYGLPGQALVPAGQVLIPAPDASKPTITVKAGAPITIFVARDLDFGSAQPRP